MEAAVKLRRFYGSARIILDPSFLRSIGIDVLAECIDAKSAHIIEDKTHLLRDLIESAPVAMAIFDAESPYKVLAHNAAYQKLWGEPFKTEGVVGKYIPEYTPKAEEDGIFEIFREVAQTREPVTVNNFVYDGMDRGRTWWNLNLSPIIHEDKIVAFAHMLVEITDHVLARNQVEALAEEAERQRDQLQAIIDNAPASVFVKDTAGRLMIANEPLAEIAGIAKDQLVGKTSYDLYPPDVAEAHTANDNEVMRSGEARESEEIAPGSDGNRTFLSLKFPLRDKNGRIYGIGGISSEITDRKRMEEELRESEEHYRELVQNANSAIIRWKSDGTITFFNEYAQQLFGYSEDEILGRNVQVLVPETESTGTDLSTLAHDIVKHPDEYIHYTHQNVLRDGGRVWMTWTNKPIFDENGQVAEILAVGSDVTERKWAEEEVARAREEAEERAAQLQSWFSSMADGVTLLNADGNVVMLNEAGKELLNVSGDRLVGSVRKRTKWFTLDNVLVPAEETATFRALLQGETIKEERYRIVTATGKEVVVSVSAAPVRDTHGRIIGAVNVFRDVEERVQVERQQQELLERERRIADVLQKALVPPNVPTRIGNYRIAVKYQSALREAEIGGDFYDVFELGSGRIGVLIGDVAGKGLPAAIRVAAARYAIRSYAFLDLEPARVMRLANEALFRDKIDESGMLTAFLAVVDPNTGIMTYANAGHEPPVVVSSDGAIAELTSQGIPLSILSDFDYRGASREFNPGDRIVMVTDGITEARNANIDLFEKQGIIDYLLSHRTASADEVANGLLEAAKEHAGGKLQDDAAIVVFEQNGKADY